MSKANKRQRALWAALKTLWASVPPVDCKGLCQASCGPIAEAVGNIELDRVRATISDPSFEFESAYGQPCPMLTSQGFCAIHDVRPLICRMYGVVKHRLMQCEHGCSGRKISDAQGDWLLAKLRDLEAEYDREVDHGEALGTSGTAGVQTSGGQLR